jgi:hypothetical protein
MGDAKMRSIAIVVLVVALPGVALGALTNAERKSQFEKSMASIIAAYTPQKHALLIKDYIAASRIKARRWNS